MLWTVEGLPKLLHLSLFLFFCGLAVFLFDVDREVFKYVIWWFGLFFLVYGIVTLLPLFRQDSPYNSPLSTPVWFLCTATGLVTFYTFYILAFIVFIFVGLFSLLCTLISCPSLPLCILDLGCTVFRPRSFKAPFKYYRYYLHRISGGVEEAVDKTVSKRTLEIDLQIVDWTISTLDDDDSLKSFFEAVPGFFDSKLVEKDIGGSFSKELDQKFRNALGGFARRTCTSNSINDSEKIRRLDISFKAMSQITSNTQDRTILLNLFRLRAAFRDDEAQRTVKMGDILPRLLINNDEDNDEDSDEDNDEDNPTLRDVQLDFARTIVSERERNDNWVTLVSRAFDQGEQYLRDNIALGNDSVLLAILIHEARRQYHSFDVPLWDVLRALSKFDIHNTHPRVQHDFCTLWNEIVQRTRGQSWINHRSYLTLKRIRHLYIALHQGTDAAPTAFSASTDSRDHIFEDPSSYPVCKLASHRPDSTSDVSVPPHTPPGHSLHALSPSPTDGGNTTSRQAEHVNNVIESATSEIGATSHGHEITLPINPADSSFPPSRTSPTAVEDAAPQDITSTVTLSHPVEQGEHQDSDLVSPSAEPGTTASTRPPTTPKLAPIPISLPKGSSESHDAGVASISNPLHFTLPSIDSSSPASRPTNRATLPRPRPRGLVNARNICFANAVLQLLVNSPPFWDLFRELADLKAQRGARVPETGGSATPLVDATLRFFEEFSVLDESPSTQQQSQPATGGTSRVDEEKKDKISADPFEPTYMYNALTEKRQLKTLLVRSRAHIVACCY